MIAPGTAALDEDFKRAMRRFVSTVCILSCRDAAGAPCGMTATAVTSLSLEPPSVLVSVNRASSFGSGVSGAKAFCVNVLSPAQAGLVRVFASPANRSERFSAGVWASDPATGAPVLEGAQANFICEPLMLAEYGSHLVVAGRVLDIVFDEKAEPLAYFERRWFAVRSPDKIL